MSRKHRLGDLQLAIMRVLWRDREATAGQVHAALLEERGLAPTTISTMLSKMEAKGVVTHRVDGRVFIYRASIAEAAVRETMVHDLVGSLFQGDPTALVSHLLHVGEVDPNELVELKARIEARREQEDADV